MKKILLLFGLTVLIITFSYAQSNIGIGTPTPSASAMLDVTASNKGFLMPRIALASVTDALTIPSPAAYLMVINTNASLPDGKGLYVNMGTPLVPNWVKTGAGSPPSNAWSLAGNTGTVDATNFIGTTDNIPFNIRVNNQRAGRIDSALKNTFWGYQSGNSATTGNSNTAYGFQSLYSNTNGNYNTATGYQALFSALTGGTFNIPEYNTANGYKSLYSNTTGLFNTANGATALYSNTFGQKNTAIGADALFSNAEGSRNTAIGIGALSNNTYGNNNTSLGYYANSINTSGSNNTAIGNNTSMTQNFFSNTTSLGNGALIYGSNTVQIGNEFVTDVFFGNPYTTNIHANSITPSDARFKYNIQNNVPGLDFIKKLKPVTYYLDEEKLDEFRKTGIISNNNFHATSGNNKKLHSGFLAQDVEKSAKELGYNFDGVYAPVNDRNHYSLAYSQFVMPLVKAVQEQQAFIEEQKRDISSLKAKLFEVEALKTQVAELIKLVSYLQHK